MRRVSRIIDVRDPSLTRTPAGLGLLGLSVLTVTALSCDGGKTKYIGSHTGVSVASCQLTPSPPPADLGFAVDPFYEKYLDGNGIPVLASSHPDDVALQKACEIVVQMLAGSDAVREAAIGQRLRVAVIARDEFTTTMPEHRDLYQFFPQQDWDGRTRGVGATTSRPLSSVGEENLLCLSDDWFRGEAILVASFSHGIRDLGIFTIDSTFRSRVNAAFRAAVDSGRWAGTVAETEVEQYFSEGVQDWFNANLEADPPDGVHNFVNTRDELRGYDPTLAALIAEYLPETDWRPSCPVGGGQVFDTGGNP